MGVLKGDTRSLDNGSYHPYPKGPRTQIGVLGPKYYNLNGMWDLKPSYSGPWTLRAPL